MGAAVSAKNDGPKGEGEDVMDAGSVKIDRPIFIVGMPRSGTTIFYEKMALHPEVAFLSQNTRKFPRAVVLSRLHSLIRRNPKPTEAPRVWMRAVRKEDDTLTRADATPKLCRYYRDVVATQLLLAGKPRFLGKYPRNGLRLEFLNAIFPDCLFVHLIRDGRAVAKSILEKRESHGGRNAYWGIRPPGWRDLLDRNPIEAIGLQYAWSITAIRAQAKAFSPDRYREVRYEDFCANPKTVLEQTAGFCGLTWPPAMLDRVTEGIRDRNSQWQELFATDELATLERTMGPLLRDLGYKA
jgi:hypothetical protein